MLLAKAAGRPSVNCFTNHRGRPGVRLFRHRELVHLESVELPPLAVADRAYGVKNLAYVPWNMSALFLYRDLQLEGELIVHHCVHVSVISFVRRGQLRWYKRGDGVGVSCTDSRRFECRDYSFESTTIEQCVINNAKDGSRYGVKDSPPSVEAADGTCPLASPSTSINAPPGPL